ncbi:tetratricopeptide repeat protein [Sorangium sp. So ce1024]|uniref:tetratricopeptide repeat protein n=1 Tax=unclassified Sorangium TaxID=2621164 RepID=UPI003F0C0142
MSMLRRADAQSEPKGVDGDPPATQRSCETVSERCSPPKSGSLAEAFGDGGVGGVRGPRSSAAPPSLEGVAPEVRAHALRERANLLLRRNDHAGAGRDYDEALALFRALGDAPGQAQVLLDRGALRLREGVPVQAVRDCDEALALYQAVGDRAGEGDALRARGFARAEEGDLGGAVCDYDAAIQLFLQLGDREPLKPRVGSRSPSSDADGSAPSEVPRARPYGAAHGRALKARGDLRVRLRNLPGAARDYSTALALFQGAGDRGGQASVLKARGDMRLGQDNMTGAARDYDWALTLYQATDDHLGQAGVLKARGDLRTRQGDLAGAERDYDQALELFTTTRDLLGQAQVLKARGDLRSQQEDLVDAVRDYDRALALFRSAFERRGQAATLKARGDLRRAQFELVAELVGVAAADASDLEEALSDYDQALALFEVLEDGAGQAGVLRARGDLARIQGDFGGALSLYLSAKRLLDVSGNAAELSATLAEIARTHALAGRSVEARAAAEQSLARADRATAAVYRELAEAVLAGRIAPRDEACAKRDSRAPSSPVRYER